MITKHLDKYDKKVGINIQSVLLNHMSGKDCYYKSHMRNTEGAMVDWPIPIFK
jgi:hypothetical protein